MTAGDLPLGKPAAYPERYSPDLLRAIERAPARAEIGIGGTPPFTGEDVWNGYELSWLAPGGMPRIGVLNLRVPCESPAIVESKSLKLYLNSFAQTPFAHGDELAAVIQADLSRLTGASVTAAILAPTASAAGVTGTDLPGFRLDDLELEVRHYQYAPELLAATAEVGADAVHTHLFRSVCPITGQPDWGSMAVAWRGRLLDRAALLAYLVSYRQSGGFHEHLVERILVDVGRVAAATEITVYGYFLRRGGIDINPFRLMGPARSTRPPALRLPRH